MLELWEVNLLNKTFRTELEYPGLEESDLYTYQQNALRQFRRLIQYLQDKYPGYAFEISRYEPAGVDTPYHFYEFHSLGQEKDNHAVWSKDTGYKDDFYGRIMEPAFDQNLSNALKVQIPELVDLYTFFKTPYGKDDVVEDPYQMVKNTEIFVHGNAGSGREDVKGLINQIKSVTESMGIRGAFRVYVSDLFTSGMTIDDCWKLWKTNRKQIMAGAFVSGKEAL